MLYVHYDYLAYFKPYKSVLMCILDDLHKSSKFFQNFEPQQNLNEKRKELFTHNLIL